MPGEVVLGVGGQKAQDQLQAAPVDVQDRAGGGRVDLAGGQLRGVSLALGLGLRQFLLAGCDLLLGAGDQLVVLGPGRDGGVGEQFCQRDLGIGQCGLGLCLGFFSGGEGRVGFQLGVHYLIGVIVGERVEAVVDHVVFEHVLLGPPAAQPAGQLGRVRVEPPADRLGDHLAVLEQGQLPDGLAVVVQGDLLVGPGDLALAAAAQGDGLHDGQQRGGREGGAAPGQPVIPGRVYRGEGAGERRPAVEHDQRPAGRAGLVARWEGVGERCERGRQGGAQRGGLAGGERDRPSGQVADVGVVVALGGLAAARVAAERDRLVAGVLSDVVIGQVHLRLGGLDGEHLAGQAALQRQRVAGAGELAQAFSPGPQGGQGREPGQRPGVGGGQVLGLLQGQRAEGERQLGAHQDAQVVDRRAGPGG